MRENNARNEPALVIYLPPSKEQCVEKLAKLSALSAAREWERAALVALLVKPGKRGRPAAKTVASDRYTIMEFCRLGVYGFRSRVAVRAYLRAWEISGFTEPQFGTKLELPSIAFPETSEIYQLNPEDDEPIPEPLPPAPNPEPIPDPPEDERETDEEHDRPEDKRKPERKREPAAKRNFLSEMDRLIGKAAAISDEVAAQWDGEEDAALRILDEITAWAEAMRQMLQLVAKPTPIRSRRRRSA